MKVTIRNVIMVLTLIVTVYVPGRAQSRTVMGTVTENGTGISLPGISVYQKGTSLGTMTDANGNFSIKVSDSTTLVFSAIGYRRQEVKVGNKESIDVSMHVESIDLDEVIVVGYGEQKRSNVTGAVASVNVTDTENKSVLRLDQALQGMVSGVTVARDGGAPGARPSIHIRGVGSIGSSDPLWIVDGIRMEPGNHFNLDDAESIEVLKDAAAAAIYGTGAAHGVILVTTKRGKGNVKIGFKSAIGKRMPIRLPHLLNSADFVKYKKQSREAAGQNPEPSWDNYQHDTDWIEAFYGGSGVIQSYDLDVSKGDDKMNYYLSLSHDDENGILIDNSYKRYSARLNSDVKLTRWLKLGESMLLSRVIENPIGNNNENYSGAIPYRSIPIMPIRDENNPYGGWGRAPVYFQGPNPVATQYQQHEKRTYNRLDGNAYLEATPLKGLVVKGSVGFNYLAYLGEKFDEAFSYGSFANLINALTYSTAHDQTITGYAVVTYAKNVGKHHAKIMAGNEAIQFDSKHFNVTGTSIPVDIGWSMNLAGGTISNTDRYTIDQNRLLSYFGRFNYDYDEKYLVELNYRRDASGAKFGPANRWGSFPSVSVGWRISREDFFNNVPYVSNLKVRASYGALGSDKIPSFIYSKTYTSQFSTYSFDKLGANKVPGYFISRFPNSEVKWEAVTMKNIAVDIGAFENKLSVSFDYYIKDTEDLLFAVPVPPSIGIAVHNFSPVNPSVNIGVMRNTGLDVELSYRHNVGKFAFSAGGNVSFVKNEMKQLFRDATITGGNGGGQIGGMTRTEAGYSISSFYGYVVEGIFLNSTHVYNMNTYAKDGTYQEAGTAPGDFIYKDLSGPDGVPDGEITAQYDRTYLGNPWPKMTYALNLNVAYNSIVDLSLQLQGVQGVDIFNANKAYSRNFFGDNNTTTNIFDAWTAEQTSRWGAGPNDKRPTP